MSRLRVALCQLNTTVGDLDGNTNRIMDALARAEAAGADLAAFPELAITGYPPEDLVLKPGFVADNQAAVAKVAARTGLAASALRYYEREQIIESADRKGLRRQYGPEVLDTLAVVAMCRRAGFSLSEIKLLLATRGRSEWKIFATRKRDELRAQVDHLGTIANQLDHALRCPSPNVFDCEHFRARLRAALPFEPHEARRAGPR